MSSSNKKMDKQLKRNFHNIRKSNKRWEKATHKIETKNLLEDNTCYDCYWFHDVQWSTYVKEKIRWGEQCDCLIRYKILKTNKCPELKTCRWWEWIYQYE